MSKKDTAPKPYRGISDEIKEQTKKFKNMTPKEKWEYFWEYYKVPTIAIICVIFFVVTFARDIITAKDYCFNGIMLNSSMLDQEKLEASFAEYAGLDTEKYDCYIDTLSTLSYQNPSEYEMATSQRIVALIQSKELDALVFNSEVFYNYSFNQVFYDLREVFTEEELSKYEGQIYYIDYAKIREAEAATNSDGAYALPEMTPEEVEAEAQTHRDPSAMEDPVPVGIYLDESPFFTKTNSYLGLVPIYGISCTSQKIETSKQYLSYLFDETIDFENMVGEFY